MCGIKPARHVMTNTQSKEKNLPIAQIIGIAMLTWALVPTNPYGYYVLLRYVICGICIYLAVKMYGCGKNGWVWTLCITAAIYNPFIRGHLTRDIWSVVNVATIALLAITIRILHTTTKGKT